jgi:nucleoside-diphosphate kinase
MADATERTFIMIKPDGVQRGVVGDVIHRFEQRGYKLVGLKLLHVSLRKFIFKQKTIS